MYKIICGFLIIAFAFQGCVKSKSKEMEVVTVDEMNTHLQYNSDPKTEIHSKEDFKKSHLVNAENIVANKEEREGLKDLDKNSPIAIYFTSENKTNEAALILQDLGFQQIYILDSGIKKWSSDNDTIK
jgi:rhodanese-related sulfurtransferase